jgi:hypothetical protein
MPIPADIAAVVLYWSDRTCCVCRQRGRPVQVHHLDENSRNNAFANLAVLCVMCHGETHTYGGFARRLDSIQIMLFRDEWIAKVGRALVASGEESPAAISDEAKGRVAAQLLEAGRFDLLARHFHLIRRFDLRDHYVERALRELTLTPRERIELRMMQGRASEIPHTELEEFYTSVGDQEGVLQLARWQNKLGRFEDAAVTYCGLISALVAAKELFAAAFCMKELAATELESRFFHMAYEEAGKRDDLWLSVRCLQELNWHSEMKRLLLRHEAEIEAGDHHLLRFELFRLLGDRQRMNSAYVALYEDLVRQTACEVEAVTV